MKTQINVINLAFFEELEITKFLSSLNETTMLCFVWHQNGQYLVKAILGTVYDVE